MPRDENYQKERSERQMARILAALQNGPMTMHQLAEVTHSSRANVLRNLQRFAKRPNRRVYVCSYEFNVDRGRPRFVYALGGGRDITIEQYQGSKIIEAMIDFRQPWDTEKAAQQMAMNLRTTRNYICYLRNNGKIRIAGYAWSGRTRVALYLVGKGQDVPMPAHMPVVLPVRHEPASIFAALGL